MTWSSIFKPGATRDDGLFAVIAFFLLYGLLHGAITRGAGPALALDDVKLNILTQSLQAGYLPVNPPLYEWLLTGVQQVFGPTLLSFIIAKYFWLMVAAIFSYLTLVRTGRASPDNDPLAVQKSVQWSVAGTLSLVLFYQIGWNYHQAFTHTTALIATTAFFWWALTRLIIAPSLTAYVMLGFALGLGALSKYSFLASASIAILVAIRYSAARSILLRPQALISFGVFLLVISPHLYWVLEQNSAIAQTAHARLQGDDTPFWPGLLGRAASALWAVGAYFLVFAPIAVAVFGARFLRRNDAPVPAPIGVLIARDAAIVGAVGLILTAAILGIENLQERYVIPFLFPVLFWFVHRISTVHAETSTGPKRLMLATMLCLVFVAGARITEMVVAGPPFCGGCRQWVPYGALGEALETRKLTDGTLVGYEDNTAGNLRRLFPGARVLSGHLPYFTPPVDPARDAAGTGAETCVFVWSEDLGPPPPAEILAGLNPDTAFQVNAAWRHWRRPDGWRTTRWTVAPLNHNRVLANSICRW